MPTRKLKWSSNQMTLRVLRVIVFNAGLLESENGFASNINAQSAEYGQTTFG